MDEYVPGNVIEAFCRMKGLDHILKILIQRIMLLTVPEIKLVPFIHPSDTRHLYSLMTYPRCQYCGCSVQGVTKFFLPTMSFHCPRFGYDDRRRPSIMLTIAGAMERLSVSAWMHGLWPNEIQHLAYSTPFKCSC